MAEESADISMDDIASSPNVAKNALKDDEGTSTAVVPSRQVSQSAVKRVYRSRVRARSRLSRRAKEDEDDETGSEEEYDDQIAGNTVTSNHHYTFNMPSLPTSKSEVPYMLLGYVLCYLDTT